MIKNLSSRRTERGQAFVEMAVSILFLLILISAVIDLGWALYTVIALRDAAQEAASYAAICPPISTDAAALPRIMDRLRKSAGAPLNINDIPDANIRVCVVQNGTHPDSCDSITPPLDPAFGRSVRIEVWVNHEIRTPFVATFIGTTSYPLKVDVSDTILRVKTTSCH